MSGQIGPDDAAQALARVRDHQERVIQVAAVPTWYWWLVAALIVALPAAIETGEPVVIGLGVTGFVAGLIVGTGWVVRHAVRVQPSNRLFGRRGIAMILGFVAVVLGATLGLAFGLSTAGVPRPATMANTLGAVLLVVGGPLLTRSLRRVMRDNRIGGTR